MTLPEKATSWYLTLWFPYINQKRNWFSVLLTNWNRKHQSTFGPGQCHIVKRLNDYWPKYWSNSEQFLCFTNTGTSRRPNSLLFCDFSPQIHQSTKNAEKKSKTQTPQCEPYSNPGGDRNDNINVKQDHSHQLFWFEPEKVSQRLMC